MNEEISKYKYFFRDINLKELRFDFLSYRKDPNKPPVKIDLPDVAPKPAFRPDEKRRGQPWPYPNLLAKSKFPDIDMYTIDKLAHKYRWTTTTGHQLEEAALPVPEV